jgi:hypothetical protein
MKIISIDPSKQNTGIYEKFESYENASLFSIDLKTSAHKTLDMVYAYFNNLIQKNKYDFGLIEDYSFNFKKKYSIIPMVEVGTAIRLAFIHNRVPLVAIHHKIWKALTLKVEDKENNRDIYFELIKQRFGKVFDTTHEAEAYLIYQSARILFNTELNLTEAMEKVKKKLNNILEACREDKN